MASVTVCVPAYQVGCFIGDSLRSLQEQTFDDFTVEIAIEPPAREIRRMVEPFLWDSRIYVRENSTRLGWDANIAAQLGRVRTPFFVVLPHDDKLHPEFLSTLLTQLKGRPDALLAYCDSQRFGERADSIFMDLPANGTVEQRLLAFFLAAADATAWRGVYRSEAIRVAGGFPVDGYGGFAVECEWVLNLLLVTPAIRCPRLLYLKRIQPPEVATASVARRKEGTPERLLQAMDRHRTRMLAPLAGIGRETRDQALLALAAEAAMIHRHQRQLDVLSPDLIAQAEQLLTKLEEMQRVDGRAAKAGELVRRALRMHARNLPPVLREDSIRA